MTIKFTEAEESTHNNEHTVQVQMVNLLANAIIDEQEKEEVLKILDQLLTFSQVHFMSEQLIMRQHSYEGYDEHEIAHGKLIDGLQGLKQQLVSDEVEVKKDSFNDLRAQLLDHIATHDQRLSGFLYSQN